MNPLAVRQATVSCARPFASSSNLHQNQHHQSRSRCVHSCIDWLTANDECGALGSTHRDDTHIAVICERVQTHAQATRYVEVADLPLAPHSPKHRHHLVWVEPDTLRMYIFMNSLPTASSRNVATTCCCHATTSLHWKVFDLTTASPANVCPAHTHQIKVRCCWVQPPPVAFMVTGLQASPR